MVNKGGKILKREYFKRHYGPWKGKTATVNSPKRSTGYKHNNFLLFLLSDPFLLLPIDQIQWATRRSRTTDNIVHKGQPPRLRAACRRMNQGTK
jgi:hypothetical protein